VVVLALLSGCNSASIRSTDRLEAQLRDQQRSVDSLQSQLAQVESKLAASRRESAALRKELSRTDSLRQVGGGGVALAFHEQFQADRLEIVTLLSGGLDRDGIPGDELLTLLVAPRDSTGETLKVAGTLAVKAFDYSLPEGEQAIGHWDFDIDESARLWHSGVVGRGYRLTVPLKLAPQAEQITVHARLTTPGGQQLNTTGQIRFSGGRGESAFSPEFTSPPVPGLLE
jgi:hypothetical protein